MQWPQVKGTLLLSPHNGRLEEKALVQAAGLLKGGNLVAFPTETVYGLGAAALDRLPFPEYLKLREGLLIIL